ncbi:MAG: isoprenylcysteine carboxylmethyltransferase family protein [bacterium]|nr:isoprenylcysteine carboxylmethyltransferase family protein [bacterium]
MAVATLSAWLRMCPPLYFGVSLLAGLGLHYALGKPLLLPLPYAFPLAMVFFALAVGIVASALGCFWRAKTPWHPHHAPCALVTRGLYRFSRNPGYLALLLILIGLVFWTRGALVILSPVIFFITMSLIDIPSEERTLEERFGEDFRRYCRDVRRWL